MENFAELDVIAKFVFLMLIKQRPGISDSELINLACKSMYMDYFSYAAIKAEMQEKKLAKLSIRKNEPLFNSQGSPLSRWDLTPTGEIMVANLNPTIPDAVLQFLQTFDPPSPLTQENISKIVPSGYGDYWVILQIVENNRIIFEYKLIVPNEKAGKPIARLWQTQGLTLYEKLLSPFINEQIGNE